MNDLQALLEFQPDHLAWPLAPREALESLPLEKRIEYLIERKEQIERSIADPLRYQYVLPSWDLAEQQIKELREKFPRQVIKLIIWGGNRSAKTRWASRYVVRDIAFKPGRRWWCCDSTEAMARMNQMRLMYEQFPPEWRNLPMNNVTKINYSQARGFSDNMLVCPNKSEAQFKFYSMDVHDQPGPELDGIWADELIPLEWVNTLRFRLTNRGGILIITFTPEFGWNDTVGYFYEGAEILKEVDAPLLPKYDEEGNRIGFKQVPLLMQCADPTARIVFFHSSQNPFGNFPGLLQELQDKTEEEILIRAYGLALRSHGVAFPRFSRKAHVITEAQFQATLKMSPKGERNHLVDPCDGRTWFMIWVFCPYPQKWIVYREWPSHGHKGAYIEGVGMPGPWALSGAAADGVKGPAQDTMGWNLESYRDEIINKEGGEFILARYIDSRYSSSPRTESARVTTLLELINEVGMDFQPMVAGKGRIISAGDKNDGSIEAINSALYYDSEVELGEFSPKMGRINEPQLQILETCPNTIWALEHFTGDDGQKGACKDPIDCLRGLFLTKVDFLGEDANQWRGGGVPK